MLQESGDMERAGLKMYIDQLHVPHFRSIKFACEMQAASKKS